MPGSPVALVGIGGDAATPVPAALGACNSWVTTLPSDEPAASRPGRLEQRPQIYRSLDQRRLVARYPAQDIPEGFSPHFRKSGMTDPWEPLYARNTGDAIFLGLRAGPAHANSRGFVHGALITALAGNAMGLSCGLQLVGATGLVTVGVSVDINDRAAFNRWAGFTVSHAAPGQAYPTPVWRGDLGQYAGYLHAGLAGALIDTACGFAAVTLSGAVLASTFTLNCLAPAMGERFISRERVIRAGRKQVFTSADLFAVKQGKKKLVATGTAILAPSAA
jgi:acyl-coenzyme A thioesterase PaaI-like protein